MGSGPGPGRAGRQLRHGRCPRTRSQHALLADHQRPRACCAHRPEHRAGLGRSVDAHRRTMGPRRPAVGCALASVGRRVARRGAVGNPCQAPGPQGGCIAVGRLAVKESGATRWRSPVHGSNGSTGLTSEARPTVPRPLSVPAGAIRRRQGRRTERAGLAVAVPLHAVSTALHRCRASQTAPPRVPVGASRPQDHVRSSPRGHDGAHRAEPGHRGDTDRGVSARAGDRRASPGSMVNDGIAHVGKCWDRGRCGSPVCQHFSTGRPSLHRGRRASARGTRADPECYHLPCSAGPSGSGSGAQGPAGVGHANICQHARALRSQGHRGRAGTLSQTESADLSTDGVR